MRHSPHLLVSNRLAWLALASMAVLAGCGGGGGGGGQDGDDRSEAALAANVEETAAVRPVPPGKLKGRGPVDPLLRSTNAAANQAVQLKCNQTFANRARHQAAAYGDVMRQRRLADICANLPAPN